MTNNHRALRLFPKVALHTLSSLLVYNASAQIVANDDGSAGNAVATTSEDASITTGPSVTTNDTGTFEVLSTSAISAGGSVVTIDDSSGVIGRFTYDPSTNAAAQMLQAGESLEDTFNYTIIGQAPLTPNVTASLIPTAAVNDVVWGGLPPITPASAGAPSAITSSYDFSASGTATRAAFTTDAWNTTSVSLEFWIKQDTLQDCTLFETGGSGTGSGVYLKADGGIEWVVKHNGQLRLASTASMTAGTWHHLVVTFDVNLGGNDTTTIWLDGVNVGSDSTRTNLENWSGGDGAGLGGLNGDAGGDDANPGSLLPLRNSFDGELGLFRFYSGTVMGEAEVIDNRDSAFVSTDSATVTVEVTGANDAPSANDDFLNEGPFGTQTYTSSRNLLSNDGRVVSNGGASLIALDYDAALAPSNSRWLNVGTGGSAGADWVLRNGVSFNPSVTSSLAQISAALEFDGSPEAYATFPGTSGSINDLFPGGTIDTLPATLEIWVKPGVADLGQIATLFETGGGTGLGVVIDNGVLKAATGLDGANGGGSTVSYDLTNDPGGVLNGQDPNDEFFQVAVAIVPGTGLTLYVNGSQVDASGGAAADWDGGDASGLGRYGENNHGGFQNTAVNTPYGNTFNGSIAKFRLYSDALSAPQVRQNYEAVANGTDIDGDTLTISGVIDSASNLVAIGNQAILPSGATVTMNDVTGAFTYDPNGAFNLTAGDTAEDSFVYRINDGNGATSEATVTILITGAINAVEDTLAVTEGEATNFGVNALVGNDGQFKGTPGAYLDLQPDGIAGGTWTNEGTSADIVTITGATSTPPELTSAFGSIGQAVGSATTGNSDPISTGDATIEVWFKPAALLNGKFTIWETGGNGNGSSLVYDADTGSVIATVDGGDDVTQSIQATAGGVVTSEFNQVVFIYDRDAVGVQDNISIHLNSEPNDFDPGADSSGSNVDGNANDWSGSDGSGIGSVSGTSALNENFPGLVGEIASVRVYPFILNANQIEANFNDMTQPLSGIDATTSNLGASITINPDGTITLDYSGVTSIAPGATESDSFTYSISDGAGGTASATVNLTVTGIDESFLASDDDFPISATAGVTSFDAIANDTFPSPPGVTIGLPITIGSYPAAIANGVNNGDPANFPDGWQLLWNAPTDWVSGVGSVDATTGPLGDATSYTPLVWDATLNAWTVDSDGVINNATSTPGTWTRLTADGFGHPGFGSADASTSGNNLQRYAIVAFTVPADGIYGIANSSIRKISAAGDGLEITTYVDSTFKATVAAAPGVPANFNQSLGQLTAGEVIYVAVGPGPNNGNDGFENFAFDVVELPTEDLEISGSSRGIFSTDGSTISYDPNGKFDFLPAGQTIVESIDYAITDGARSTTATFNVTVSGVNDAPIANDDALIVTNALPGAGNVIANDADPDLGESSSLTVVEVNGSAANVGSEITLPSGALLTVASDGSVSYDANGAFNALAPGEITEDSFSYLPEDSQSTRAAEAASVIVVVIGAASENQQPFATFNTTVNYPAGTSNIGISPPVTIGDPDGLFSTINPVFATGGPASVAIPDPGVGTGFVITLAFTPSASDVAASAQRVVWEIGGTSNGHGIYLLDGVPYLLGKMDTTPDQIPANGRALDNDWDLDGTILIPLGSALPADTRATIDLRFERNSVTYNVNGSGEITQPLLNLGTRDNWSGDDTLGFGQTSSNDGATSDQPGDFNANQLVNMEGSFDQGSLATFGAEGVTLTLTINPTLGGFTAPAGSTYDGSTGIWSATGPITQVQAALAAVEFLPNGNASVTATARLEDGFENGTVAVTGNIRISESSDNDGVDDLLEFAFGMSTAIDDDSPLAIDGSANGLPIIDVRRLPGGALDYRGVFVRRDDFGSAGSVTYTPQFSSNLVDWFDGSAFPSILADSTADSAYEIVSVNYPALLDNGQPALFFRVKVNAVE